MIDDQPMNVLDCVMKGIRVLLFDQTWNRKMVLPEGVERVMSWEEIVEKIG